ncbi:MAG: tetratricopeptide repeat protein [Betaproteobacteria bacterium]|nr:tetratricopeptide repeat protein [Betaproteobacteria bacterium]
MTKTMAHVLIAVLAAITAPAWSAAGGGGADRAPEDPVVVSARTAFEKKDWVAAAGMLKDALARNPQNADYHNLYAYATRKGANPDMNLVFKHYNEALRIDPKHLNAHEYIGEAYLMINNLAKAKEHLAALDRLCFFGCEEYDDLKKAVAAYEKQKR